jgi:hypothetical protein
MRMRMSNCWRVDREEKEGVKTMSLRTTDTRKSVIAV